MKHLKKVSLSKQIPDDLKVAILNDSEKRRLFQQKPNPRQSGSLLTRLWTVIEHWPNKQRRDAIKVIQALESAPSFGMNENFEMVYNGDVIGGTNILQLIKSRVRPPASGRTLIPRQDLFEHILTTAPLEVPRPTAAKKQRYDKPATRKVQKLFSISPRKTRRQATTPIRDKRWSQ